MTSIASHPISRDRALRSGDRWLASICLLVVAGTHVPLIPEHLREATYVGVAFILLALTSVLLAGALLVLDTISVWASVAVLNGLAVIAYVVTRTVGLPLLGDDVGNWLEPLSFPALASELIAVAAAMSVLRGESTGPRRRLDTQVPRKWHRSHASAAAGVRPTQ